MNIDEKVKLWVRPGVLEMRAYQVPDAAGMVKLDAMENPYVLPAELRSGLLAALQGARINRYPDPAARALSEKLRQVFSIDAALGLMLGNGSDELLQLIVLALARPGAVIVAPEPAFALYPVVAEIASARHVGVPLREDGFALDLPATLDAIRTHRPALVILAFPNNPTGNLYAPEEVLAIVREQRGLVLIDEAYQPFAGQSCASLLATHDNVVILRTVSKLGLAGLRLGYAFANPAWIAQFDKLRLPYNVGVLTQAAAVFLLDHVNVFNEQVRQLVADRDSLSSEIARIPGMHIWPSRTNFVLFRAERGSAAGVHAELRSRGILVKDVSRAHPMLRNCLRVTVGTPSENDQFLRALRDVAQ